jgi:opacity protein-like surface antigen
MSFLAGFKRESFRAVSIAAGWLLAAALPANGEGYVAAYAGGAATRTADVTLKQSGAGNGLVFEQAPFSGRSFESPIYYGYRAGFYFSRHLGVEAEFIHLKVHADLDQPVTVQGSWDGSAILERSPMRRYAQQFEISHGLNLVLLNVVARRTLIGSHDPDNARLMFVARGGLGPTIPRPEVIVFGVAGGAYQTGPVAMQAAAGLEVRLWRGLHVLTEYKYTFTPTSFDIPEGHANLDVRSHHVVTGLAVHF